MAESPLKLPTFANLHHGRKYGGIRQPPLCKGRWHGVCRDGGIVHYDLKNNPSGAFGASSPYTGEPLIGKSLYGISRLAGGFRKPKIGTASGEVS